MIAPTPFDKKGKTFTLVLVLTLAAIWLVSIYVYLDLPAEVPTHFGFTGKPISYGNKATFLLLPFLFARRSLSKRMKAEIKTELL